MGKLTIGYDIPSEYEIEEFKVPAQLSRMGCNEISSYIGRESENGYSNNGENLLTYTQLVLSVY